METTEFKIVSNIPAPPAGAGRKAKYPLRNMKVGDSFYIPDKIGSESQVRNACSNFRARNKEFLFSISRDASGVRVWRIKA